MTQYPEKYDRLIDKETWEFIRRTNDYYPPDAVDLSIQQQRDIYDRMCREFFAGYPDGVEAANSEIHLTDPDRAILTRSYKMSGTGIAPGDKSPAAMVVYFHGGGFVVGGLDSHDDVCAEICAVTGYPVVSVDYRLGPEHTFPADFNDAIGAFRSIGQMGIPIVLVGDSAGGNLAAAVSHATRSDVIRPIGQVLIYPGLAGRLDWGTFIEHAEAPMLTTADTTFYKNIRTGGNDDLLQDPRCAPLEDTDFSSLPPTVVFSAQCDPLCGDGEAYAIKIMESGGKARSIEEQGLVHGYLRARHTAGRAKDSFARIGNAIDNLGQGLWPYRDGPV